MSVDNEYQHGDVRHLSNTNWKSDNIIPASVSLSLSGELALQVPSVVSFAPTFVFQNIHLGSQYWTSR